MDAADQCLREIKWWCLQGAALTGNDAHGICGQPNKGGKPYPEPSLLPTTAELEEEADLNYAVSAEPASGSGGGCGADADPAKHKSNDGSGSDESAGSSDSDSSSD